MRLRLRARAQRVWFAQRTCRAPEPVGKGCNEELDRKDDGEGHVEELKLPPHGRSCAGCVGELVRDLLLVCRSRHRRYHACNNLGVL